MLFFFATIRKMFRRFEGHFFFNRLKKMITRDKDNFEIRHENIREILRCTAQVRKYLERKKSVLYGGMAIHLALRAAGHEGLYHEAKLADYDFYSENPVVESETLMKFLARSDINAINALHLTTRRIRVGYTAVADISYQPFLKYIPTMTHDGLTFVHPDFQKIDLHYSLAFPFRGEHYKRRQEKDIARLNLLDELYPVRPHKFRQKKISRNRMPYHFTQNFSFDPITVSKKYSHACLAGDVALTLTALIAIREHPGLQTLLGAALRPAGTIEIFEEHPRGKGEAYDSTGDIFHPALVHKGVIRYQLYGDMISANKTEYGWIVSTHFLAATYLFKYFLLGDGIFLERYRACRLLIKYGSSPNAPNTINGSTFGSANISMPWLLSEKRESCEMVGIDFADRPRKIPRNCKHFGLEKFVAYRIRGDKIPALPDRTPLCKSEF